jgi:septal ring factor EnvC (AmiA/AmiB activator)
MNQITKSNKRMNISTKMVSLMTLFCLVFALFTFLIVPKVSLADQAEIDRLSAEIDTKRDRIAALDAEIAKQRASLNSASGRANNLENTVAELEATKNKLENDIKLTGNQIEKAELTIQKLGLEISDKEISINKNSEALAESVRRMN